jgi:hypothetical protein
VIFRCYSDFWRFFFWGETTSSCKRQLNSGGGASVFFFLAGPPSFEKFGTIFSGHFSFSCQTEETGGSAENQGSCMVPATERHVPRPLHPGFLSAVPQGAWGSRALAAIVTSPQLHCGETDLQRNLSCAMPVVHGGVPRGLLRTTCQCIQVVLEVWDVVRYLGTQSVHVVEKVLKNPPLSTSPTDTRSPPNLVRA